MEAAGVSRRALLERAGLLGLAAALAPLPEVLARKGLLDEALAASDPVTIDTLKGLCAFILPGNDAYSRAQGNRTRKPGAIAAGTVPVLIDALDRYVPISFTGNDGQTLPASGGVATLLNDYALQVNPAASHGTFLSPFSRLSNVEKAKVFERFEADPAYAGTEFEFVAGIVPGFVTFLAFSEAGVIDPKTRRVRKRPVSWGIADYPGPADGHPELKGYYHGRKHARGSRT